MFKDAITQKKNDQAKENVKSITMGPECAEMEKVDEFQALKKLTELIQLVKKSSNIISELEKQITDVRIENEMLRQRVEKIDELEKRILSIDTKKTSTDYVTSYQEIDFLS